MFDKFRDRLKNQKPWFRIDSGIQSLEGQKITRDNLRISTKFNGEWISIDITRDNAIKLADWIRRIYPGEFANVYQLGTKLPVSESKGDPGTGPGPTGI